MTGATAFLLSVFGRVALLASPGLALKGFAAGRAGAGLAGLDFTAGRAAPLATGFWALAAGLTALPERAAEGGTLAFSRVTAGLDRLAGLAATALGAGFFAAALDFAVLAFAFLVVDDCAILGPCLIRSRDGDGKGYSDGEPVTG